MTKILQVKNVSLQNLSAFLRKLDVGTMSNERNVLEETMTDIRNKLLDKRKSNSELYASLSHKFRDEVIAEVSKNKKVISRKARGFSLSFCVN